MSYYGDECIKLERVNFKNDPNIRWANKVHERITGCKTYAHLPPNEELSLYHPKTIEKQESQNELYQNINIQKG